MNQTAPLVALNDGNAMPQLGFGTWKITEPAARTSVREALAAGYRSIDTAAMYGNEAGVGAGLREAGLPRSEVFVTTKIWNTDQGGASCGKALDQSLKRLGLDYVDLYLIHWPCPSQGQFVETWRSMIKLREAGLIRSIGVCNFTPAHLRRMIEETGVKPVLNQIECHPWFQQQTLRKAHADLGLRTEAWSPLGKGKALGDPVIQSIATKHGRTPAQIVLRWHLENGLIVIPKSMTPLRIRENLRVFDFSLDETDLQALDSLDRNLRLGPDPEGFD